MTPSHITPEVGATLTPAVRTGGLVYTAGQVGVDPTTGRVPDDFATEVELALDSLEAVLLAAGSGLDRIVKATCFIADIELTPVMTEHYRGRIPEPRPARTTVQARLVPPYRFEIEVVAEASEPGE